MVRTKAGRDLRRIGAYEILARLGTGGTGSVYKARHEETGELVAVKVASAAAARSTVMRQRFELEFRAARTLQHPHIVQALDFGEENSVPYLVMELVDGKSLGQHIEDEGRLPETAAVEVGVQIALALQAAHDQGIIHRDVKPDNILLTSDFLAKLADLGLAKDLDADLNLTRTSSVLGTPNFMAPEQFMDTRNVHPGCDVYSLGATLYMAVTGQIPFLSRGHIGTLKKKMTDELAPPRQLVPGLSERVERAILRAMRAAREERPASCRQFVEELTGRPCPTRAGQLTGKERRAAPRYDSRQRGHCRPLGGARKLCWPALVRDVSTLGMGLVVERRFEPGTLLMVGLADGVGAERLILLRVVRVQPAPNRRWIVGCRWDRKLAGDDVEAFV